MARKLIGCLQFPDTPAAPTGSALVLFVYEDGGVEIDLGAGARIVLETSVKMRLAERPRKRRRKGK